MKMCSFHTMGEECPAGTAVFHSNLSDGLKVMGGFSASATPEPFPPRNRGHSTDARPASGLVRARMVARTTSVLIRRAIIIFLLEHSVRAWLL